MNGLQVNIKRYITVLKKVRERGLKWFFKRMKYLFLEKNFFPLNIVKYTYKQIIGFYDVFAGSNLESSRALTVVWDLRNQAVNFNVSEYLCFLEFALKERGKVCFEIILVSSKESVSSLKYEYAEIINSEKRLWQVDNIMLPIMRMHPLVKSIVHVDSPKEVERYRRGRILFPNDWDVYFSPPFDLVSYFKAATHRGSFQGLSPSLQAMEYVKNIFSFLDQSIKLVTITIRDYSYDVPRNSNKEAWREFLDYLIDKKYWPVVIPDTENSDGCDAFFPKEYIYKEFCWNLYLRFALYNFAFFNFGNPNGPTSMMMYSKKCRFLMMNHGAVGSVINTEEAFARHGMKFGDDYKFLGIGQRVSYLADNFENIKCEFEALEPIL